MEISDNFDFISQVDKSVMNSEAARRLTYYNWPHKNFSRYLRKLFKIKILF